MTETAAPPATVIEVLRAIDRAGLLHLLPVEEARVLTTPVIRAANGVDLSNAEQRAAARSLAAARLWLDGPLAALGLTIPRPPDPVTPHTSRAAAAGKAPLAALVDGGSRIGVRNVFALIEQIAALPGARPVGRNHGYTKFVPIYTVPGTPAGARALLELLGPFGPKVSAGVAALAEQYEQVRDGRALLEDGAPLPEIDTDTYGVGADLWHHQRRGVAWGELSDAVLFAMKMGATTLSTQILTPSGWRKMGELAVGDEVFGGDGRATAITKVWDYAAAQTYRVTFCDGTSSVCEASHLWTVHRYDDLMRAGRHGEPARRTMELAEIMADGLLTGAGRPKWFLPEQPVVDDPRLESVDSLPVHPWLLGAFLGDGSMDGSPIIYKPEPWIWAEVERHAVAMGLYCRGVRSTQQPGRLIEGRAIESAPPLGTQIGVRVVRSAAATVANPLTVALRELGVANVHSPLRTVPPRYLHASADARRELLRGLLDTDGHAARTGAVFCTRSNALAEDVAYLVRSLGGRAKVWFSEPSAAWYVNVRLWSDWVPFAMPRKAAAYRKASIRPWRTIRSVEPLDVQPVRCISVESSLRMYLTDTALIPTHNSGKTISAIALANRVQAHRVLIVCPNRVRAVWTREVRERSTVGWHIEDGTRPPAREGCARQDLPHPERLARAQHLFYDCDCGAPVHAFVLNYEALSLRVWQEWEPAAQLDLVIYDEAHRLKSYLTKVKSKKPVGKFTKEVQKRRLPDDPAVADAMVRAARLADEMGPRERRLLPVTFARLVREARNEPEPDEPMTAVDSDNPAEVRMARTLDKAEAQAEAQFRSRKLTVSGVAARWVQFSHRRVALTGTPFPQHPWDIFGLYRALDPGVFGLVWTPFKEKWLKMDRTGTFPTAVLDERLAEFADLAMSLMYRPVVDLQLPPITDVVREVSLEPKARRTYDELDAALWTDLVPYMAERAAHGMPADPANLVEAVRQAVEVEGTEGAEGTTSLTARNLLSRLLRLQQITGGTLRTDSHEDPVTGRTVAGREVRVSTVKADELAEFEGGHLVGGILDEIGCRPDRDGGAEPVIVFCRFKSDMDAVRAVAEKVGLRYGEVSGRRGDGLNADARMAEDVDLCAVQIQAGGTGVDLTRACYAIWYSLGYSVSDYDQARARLHRPGQTRPVVNIHLITTDTMDRAVYDAIRARKAAVSAVLRAGGVDPAAVGLSESDPGADPVAAGAVVDGSAMAVTLPWESRPPVG